MSLCKQFSSPYGLAAIALYSGHVVVCNNAIFGYLSTDLNHIKF